MKTTRQGKHKEGKTLFGGYVDPEIKALAELTSEALGITFTDIIINGLKHEATRAGIMLNGEIVPKFRSAYDLAVKLTKEKIESSKNTRTKGTK